MIRFTWLQFRTQAAVAIGGLAIVAVVLAITGPHVFDLYGLFTWLGFLVIVIPGIIGVFWGAPLVARELEAGTFRLAWTQSVTRTRWLVIKLAVIGLASMAVAGLLSLMVTWWASPFDRVAMNLFGTFDQRDIVPIGYAAFAFALGVTAGVLIRRTLPAMATTLVAFVTARLTFNYWIQPHLIAPVFRNFALNQVSTGLETSNGGSFTLAPNPPELSNAWIISNEMVDKAGHVLTTQVVKNDCPSLGNGSDIPTPQSMHDCVVKVGATYHQAVTYQPVNHYWALQWYELAIFLGAALFLAGFCLWWVRRRLS
jgi:hypothetical protein